MFFSVFTKNLNWAILTKNLVTFKRWNGIKDLKRGLGQFADLSEGGGLGEEDVVVF